jgi:thiol:disulfide interchange protein
MTSFVNVSASAAAAVLAFVIALPAGAPARADYTPSPPLEGVPAYAAAYDRTRDPEADFRAASAAAAARNRRVLIVVGGDWCMWCFMLDRHLRLDPEAKRLFHEGFEVMRVYYNDDNTNQAFLARFPPFEVFPHFFVVEPDGRVRASVEADIFIREAKYDTALIRGFVEQWQPK